MQYGEIERRDKEGEDTAPYDQAPPDAPDDRVITKGEHEKPGPTSVEELTGDEETETE